MSNLKETTRPSADLRNNYSDVSRQCRNNKEAIIITVNGKYDTVTLPYEEYKKMKSLIEILELLADAEADVKNGRVAPISDTFNHLRTILNFTI